MDKQEIFSMLRRNFHTRHDAIILISDFLSIDKKAATKIYEEEYLPYLKKWERPKDPTDRVYRDPITKILFVKYRGVTRRAAEWARITHIPYDVLRGRLLLLKWDVERALTTHSNFKERRK